MRAERALQKHGDENIFSAEIFMEQHFFLWLFYCPNRAIKVLQTLEFGES